MKKIQNSRLGRSKIRPHQQKNVYFKYDTVINGQKLFSVGNSKTKKPDGFRIRV
jgi:hypothetical protein